MCRDHSETSALGQQRTIASLSFWSLPAGSEAGLESGLGVQLCSLL